MNTTWWCSINQLDDDQLKFVNLPREGRYLLEGPPGSGKTNLLLLRAQYMAGEGERNVLILTYTKTLANFIRTGITTEGLISDGQIRTYHSWARDYVINSLGEAPIGKSAVFDAAARQKMLEFVEKANDKRPAEYLYSAIFVDEAQDFTKEELTALLCLSDKVCVCGDSRQGIYQRDGLDVATILKLERHILSSHFRIGQKIARVADRLLGPVEGGDLLEATSNYNRQEQGAAAANLHECASRDIQFENMLKLIRVQLDAFNDDTIGVFCATKETRAELRQYFDSTDLASIVCAHGLDENATFGGGCRIHVMTIYSCKGTEFRAVHMFGMEELANPPFCRTTLAYTAATRAKTALNAYRTGPTSPAFENAFLEPKHFELKKLFPGDA